MANWNRRAAKPSAKNDYRNLGRYPVHVRPFVKVLLDHEGDLSDGFFDYLSGQTMDETWATAQMREIANELFDAASKIPLLAGME